MKKFLLLILLIFLVFAFSGGWLNSLKKRESSDTAPLAELNFDDFRTRVAIPDQREERSAASRSNPTTTPVSAPPLVIANGTIIDGTGAAPISQGSVVIQGNRILAVGPAVEQTIPVNAKVIDVNGKTIMPGIINAHIHYGYDPVTRHRFLAEGVTAVCDLGTSLRCMPIFERELDWHNQPAARGFKAGPMLTAPGGYPGTFYGFQWQVEVATPEETQAAVENLLSRGADVIKVALEPGHQQQPWPVLSLEQVQIIVESAHAHGVLVRAHVRQAGVLDIALNANVDVIEHTPLPFCLEAELKQMLEDDRLHLEKLPPLNAQLARMAEEGVVLVPTLDANTYAISQLPRLTPTERQAAHNFLLEVVGHYRDLGGVIALGNDYGNAGVQHGLPLREMELLLAAGLSPTEVIEASTHHAALVSGHGDELGTLESGKLADLIVVDGNPLTDLDAMSQLVIVIKNGEIVFRAKKV